MRCLCASTKTKKLFRSGDYTITQCVACGQARTKEKPKKHFYTRSDISIYFEKEILFRELFKKTISFIKKFQNNGTILEIGAGAGLLVDEAIKAGFSATGYEPSRAARDSAKNHLGIDLFSALRDISAESIVVNHVLEHLENPKKLVSKLSCKYLFIGVPNFSSIMSQLKKDRWQSLVPDQHRWHFTLKTLDTLVLPFGFTRVGVTYENHDRSMHPFWKRPIYAVLDTIALATGKAEAMLVAYKKI